MTFSLIKMEFLGLKLMFLNFFDGYKKDHNEIFFRIDRDYGAF